MSSPSTRIEKIPVTAYRYQGKCTKCRRLIKGPSLKLAEKNLVEHEAAHEREAEQGRKWYANYTAKVEN